MMGEAEGRSANAAKHVKIGSFGGERHGDGGEGGFAVKAGASQAGAGQDVGDGFQAVGGILLCGSEICQLPGRVVLVLLLLLPPQRSQRNTGKATQLKPIVKNCKLGLLPAGLGVPTNHERCGTRRVRASGTIVISAGRVPRSSPSASS